MKNYIKNISIFTFLFILFLYKDIFYLIPLKLLNIKYKSLNLNLQLLLSTFASSIVILIVCFIYKKYLKEKIIDYIKNFHKYFDLGIKYWFIGICGMAIFNFIIPIISPIHEANNEALVQQMLKQSPIITFISATFIAPFLEEMLFRKSFGDIFKNKKLMVLMSGLLFGLLHVIFSFKTPWDLLYILPYGMLGGSFAYIIYKKDNIFISITFHMLHNGILTLLSIIISLLSMVSR